MNEQRLKGLMGLAVRARQAVFGEDGCLKTVRSGNCAALLLDESASEATRERYEGVCRRAETPLALLREGLLWEATGRPGKAMAVQAGSLGSEIARLVQEDENRPDSV